MSHLLVLSLLLALSGTVFSRPEGFAAQSEGCAGAWLVRIALDGRDIEEQARIAFAGDGGVEVQAPPLLPALPGDGNAAWPVSDGLGVWEETAPGECAFEFVRLLAAEDGSGLGTLDVRGRGAVDDDGNLTGSLSYTRASGLGHTEATATGSFTGFSLRGALLWLTPTADS